MDGIGEGYMYIWYINNFKKSIKQLRHVPVMKGGGGRGGPPPKEDKIKYRCEARRAGRVLYKYTVLGKFLSKKSQNLKFSKICHFC